MRNPACDATSALQTISALPSAWRRALVQRTSAFFDAEDVERVDPLVEIVRRDPESAAWFIRVVMRFSNASGVLVSVACAAFLFLGWTGCGSCDRPFRWWLLVHAVLQIMQVPVRMVFLMKLRDAEQREGSFEECVASLTSSPAWRLSKSVSFVTYAWFVLGVVWVMNADGCSACPGIYRLVLAVIGQALARVVLAVACYRALFLRAAPPTEETSKMEAAEPADIQKLPTVTFSDGLLSERDMSCAVCLCDFEQGDQLRRLPCGHYFHQKCIDEWLHRSKKCPLCNGAIDACTHAKGKDGVTPPSRPNLVRRTRQE